MNGFYAMNILYSSIIVKNKPKQIKIGDQKYKMTNFDEKLAPGAEKSYAGGLLQNSSFIGDPFRGHKYVLQPNGAVNSCTYHQPGIFVSQSAPAPRAFRDILL